MNVKESTSNKLTILWLDDRRNPYDYLKKKPESETLARNLAFYKKLMSKYDIKFAWVRNIDEFASYIENNGLPKMISFDHDLGKGLPKGVDCAKWLLNYCQKNELQVPKYYIHSANNNGIIEIGNILSGARKSLQEATFKVNIPQNIEENPNIEIGWDPNGTPKKDSVEDNFPLNNNSLFKIHLPKSNIDCLSLYDFTSAWMSTALKKDIASINGKEVNVNWVNDSKMKFLDYAAEHAKTVLEKAVNTLQQSRPDATLKYITYPQSHSHLNEIFTNILKAKLNNKDIKIIPDYILKSKTGIAIDEYTAIALGCDATDIATLREWIAEEESKSKLIDARKEMETQINAIANGICNALGNKINGTKLTNYIDDFKNYLYGANYQYLDKKETSKNKKLRGSELDNKDGEKVKSIFNKVDGTKNRLEAASSFIKASTTLFSIFYKIQSNYGSLENAYKSIEKQRQTDITSRKFNSIISSKTGEYWDDIQDRKKESNGRGSGHSAAVRKLDSTYDYNTRKIIDKTWEIKNKSEWARRILYKLFSIDRSQEELANPKNIAKNIIVVFDDNMSGGGTMDNACLALFERGWRNVIPIVLNLMPVTENPGFMGKISKKYPNLKKGDKDRDREKVKKVKPVKLATDSRISVDSIDDFDGNNIMDTRFVPHEVGDLSNFTPHNKKGTIKKRPSKMQSEPKKRGKPTKYILSDFLYKGNVYHNVSLADMVEKFPNDNQFTLKNLFYRQATKKVKNRTVAKKGRPFSNYVLKTFTYKGNVYHNVTLSDMIKKFPNDNLSTMKQYFYMQKKKAESNPTSTQTEPKKRGRPRKIQADAEPKSSSSYSITSEDIQNMVKQVLNELLDNNNPQP